MKRRDWAFLGFGLGYREKDDIFLRLLDRFLFLVLFFLLAIFPTSNVCLFFASGAIGVEMDGIGTSLAYVLVLVLLSIF